MVQSITVLVTECVCLFDAAELDRPAVEARDQVCGQDWGITAGEAVVKLLRLTELGQINLIAQGGQIIKDNGEFIDFEAIVHHDRFRAEVDNDGAIMRAAGYGVSMEERIHHK